MSLNNALFAAANLQRVEQGSGFIAECPVSQCRREVFDPTRDSAIAIGVVSSSHCGGCALTDMPPTSNMIAMAAPK